MTRASFAIALRALLVTNAILPPNPTTALAMLNPLSSEDHGLATWFHERLTPVLVAMLRAFTEFGSAEWIGVVLFALFVFFAWKKCWPSLVTLVVAVPGGMLLNEWIKVVVHRHRPFVDGPLVDWSGYSFASGHTIGATLLYGQLLLFVLPALKARHWRLLCTFSAISLVLLVGFSRIALGAHFLTDVLAAIFFGIVWLGFCSIAGQPIRRRISRFEPVISLSGGSEALLAPVEQTTLPVRISERN